VNYVQLDIIKLRSIKKNVLPALVVKLHEEKERLKAENAKVNFYFHDIQSRLL
jgi:hypothetical protein